MSNFPILDLVVGMVFVFFLLSVINNSIIEIILTFLKVRAKILEQWLRTVFNKDVTFTDATGKTTTMPLGVAIMDHVAVTALSAKGKSPSYIDAQNFVTALLEKITANPNVAAQENLPGGLDEVINALTTTPILSSELKRVFLAYAAQAKINFAVTTNKTSSPYDQFRTSLENWYNTSTDRLTGDLKRWTLILTIIIAVVMTLAMNVDSIALAQYLYSSPDARAKIAASAYATGKDTAMQNKVNGFIHDNPTANVRDSITLLQLESEVSSRVLDIKAANAALQNTFPMGWNSAQFNIVAHNTDNILMQKIPGWLLTILAICLGAPFWYDLLNRLANLRGTGPKPTVNTDGKS